MLQYCFIPLLRNCNQRLTEIGFKIMTCNAEKFFAGVVALLSMTGCTGGNSASDNTVSNDTIEIQSPNYVVDADGDWRLVSYRDGHETKIYGKNSDYVLSFSEEDMTFDFFLNNDTVDGRYKVVNDTIRFYSAVDNENHDQMLDIVSNNGCYACQENDSIIVTLPDDREAVFTRITE